MSILFTLIFLLLITTFMCSCYIIYSRSLLRSSKPLEPHFKPNDKVMFYKYLNKATMYFEFGSGGSTYQASIRDNIEHVYSVESDKYWSDKLKQTLAKHNHKVTYLFNDMGTTADTWGAPGKTATKDQLRKYSDQIVMLDPEISNKLDLILIDGRFRVACCLKCFNVINDNCVIAFDDFLKRPYYNVVLDYYDIIESSNDKHMVILKKKRNVTINSELIKKYELIQD